MIEEYGTLSDEELIQEIIAELEENGEIDPSDLDFKHVDDKLKITGTLQNEDELEVLVGILEDYVDPKDYQCEVELLEEGVDAGAHAPRRGVGGVVDAGAPHRLQDRRGGVVVEGDDAVLLLSKCS